MLIWVTLSLIYGWYSGWSTLLKAWCYYCLISNLNARIVGGESNLRRCFIRPADEIGNGFGSKAPQIIKDPQDFHFRETFLEVCVTHVSFSCSSSPRFDQVPIEENWEYWEYWGFATFVFKKTEKRLYLIYLIPVKMQNVLNSYFQAHQECPPWEELPCEESRWTSSHFLSCPSWPEQALSRPGKFTKY